MLRDFAERQSVEVSDVHRHINDADHYHAQHHGERNVASRFLYFACNPGDINPSVIGPEYGDQGNTHGGNQLRGMKSDCDADAMRTEVRPVAFADGESENYKRAHGGKFGPGGEILQQRAPAQAYHIYISENGDKQKAEQMQMANPRITNAPMAANLVQVERFCSSVPQRRPITFT